MTTEPHDWGFVDLSGSVCDFFATHRHIMMCSFRQHKSLLSTLLDRGTTVNMRTRGTMRVSTITILIPG